MAPIDCGSLSSLTSLTGVPRTASASSRVRSSHARSLGPAFAEAAGGGGACLGGFVLRRRGAGRSHQE